MERLTPDRWTLIYATINDVHETRIVSGWWGGYLDSDSWRISSATRSITPKEDHYLIDTEGGSEYICYYRRNGFTGLSANAFRAFQEKQPVTWNIVTISE